ncbi:Sorbin and SH3 domain-containing protein 1 [Araneus ventricosus]|uniref:Sorbin and SH3 domain-containing protein 1 n=1 Tax=Araneus ventricosus TaxID=182803 RepID=A0A4Y2MFR0_ARAVE|nr:Sorbin and SH3 domain-containing protein 1 [Araneus ventricosus]
MSNPLFNLFVISESRNNRLRPNSRDYGLKPPCCDHKHLPNQLSRPTDYTFHATPYSQSPTHKVNNCNMTDAKRTPTPPKRHSSANRVSALRKPCDISRYRHKLLNSDFDISSVNSPTVNRYAQLPTNFSTKYKKFYSYDVSSPVTESRYCSNSRFNKFPDYGGSMNSLGYNAFNQGLFRKVCFNNESFESSHLKPFQSLPSTPTQTAESRRYSPMCKKHEYRNYFSPFSQNECPHWQSKYTDPFEVEKILAECYGDTFCLLNGENTSSEGEDHCAGKDHWAMIKRETLPFSCNSDSASISSQNSELSVSSPFLQNGSDYYPSKGFKIPNVRNSFEATKLAKQYSLNSNTHCGSFENVERAILTSHATNGRHDPENQKNSIVKSMHFINPNRCVAEDKNIKGVMKNAINWPDKKTFPRMITILPPVIHVLCGPLRELKPQVSHSVPQNNKKLHCSYDLKPLQMYLKRYGQLLSQMGDYNARHNLTVEMILKDFYTERCSLSTKADIPVKRDKSLDDSVPISCNNYLEVKSNRDIQKGIPSLKESFNKVPCSKNILHLPNKNGMNCNNSSKLKSTTSVSTKSKYNLSLNSQNAVIYHEYIASMLSTSSKSRTFARLKNFFSSLENLNDLSVTNSKKLRHYQINTLNISWQNRSYYPRWSLNLDRSLKIRHSSVENLRQIFQSPINEKDSRCFKTTFEMSFQYKRLLYTVSVSNLVERYNKIECLKSSKLKSVMCSTPRSEFEKKESHDETFPSELKRDDSFNFRCGLSHWQYNAFSVEKLRNQYQCNSTKKSQICSLSNSNSDSLPLVPHDVQSKVRFFEDAAHGKSENSPGAVSHFIRKVNLTRNSSCCDLRQSDDNFGSSSYSRLFSPNYLPERAMSCLDLSSMSIDSFTTDQSMNYCDRASSSVSFLSSEFSTLGNDILHHGIKTGTVSQIRNKLENLLQLPSSPQLSAGFSNTNYCSVPDNLQSVATKPYISQHRCRHLSSNSTLPISRVKSGSVQDLIYKFEPGAKKENVISKLSMKHGSQRTVNRYDSILFGFNGEKESLQPFFCQSTAHFRISATQTISPETFSDKYRYERRFNHKFQENPDSWKSSVQQSMKKRIQNLISRFESSETCRSQPRKINGDSYCNFYSKNYSSSANSVPNLFINSSKKWNFPINVGSASVCQRGRALPSQSAVSSVYKGSGCHLPNNSSTFTDRNQTPVSSTSTYLQKYSPRVQNSSPRPYVRRTASNKSEMDTRTAPTHKYEESEVNIHYRSPIRHLEKEYIDEEELRKIQEDAMRKLYEEERRKKHQQELAEMEMRRHSDFFTPTQKSPIPLNRYDNPFESSYNSLTPHGFSRGPPPKTMARALYPFTAQTTRELSLNKGDIVYITKQIDKNWYEGEHHGLVGIFPVTYVEIIPNEKANLQPRKAVEGEALVKYNFRAQSPQELSLFKGEKVVLVRRLDHNWFEGRLGAKKGIFPVSYVEVLEEPREFSGTRTVSPKPPASPVFSSLISGSPPKSHEGPTFNTGLRPLQSKPPLQVEKSETKSSLTQSLHIDTYNEPIPYRALYAYKPQNDDELELKEGDTVYVMEKCDDGWYVGTSLRTGLFGTFPGNYVERI